MEQLRAWRGRIAAELDAVVAFWERHSHDPEHGGFFSCLSRDGSVYDDTKFVWLQGRQVRAWARRWAEAVWGWARGAPMELGRPRFAGTPPQQALAQALMVLKVGLQLWGDPEGDPQSQPEPLGQAMAEWGAQHVLMHLQSSPGGSPISGSPPHGGLPNFGVQRGDSVVLENVTPEGGELPGSLGRLMNPGLGAALGGGRVGLGPGGSHGAGAPPPFFPIFPHFSQLEWSMKLWWPHAEAMVALLAAQRFQPQPSLVSQFLQVAQYTFDKFRDPEHGEWFGYLNRDGSVALSIKGGPYKGCFHVARALLMCEEMLDAILEGEESQQ
ncbi:N-acylglucosamine 2-epimerase [Onychostruthus taczanowskii]|uniref:N-acylglucosamine 2-epimerase n=1 Tax=Onychostruthus taczanowskii TaxID=356909 RepID=UPI001B80074D|nr:N-acylglucosamine 2-epimerase [Onychostruthus taczanowskii]